VSKMDEKKPIVQYMYSEEEIQKAIYTYFVAYLILYNLVFYYFLINSITNEADHCCNSATNSLRTVRKI
jgi:hypothetical protein